MEEKGNKLADIIVFVIFALTIYTNYRKEKDKDMKNIVLKITLLGALFLCAIGQAQAQLPAIELKDINGKIVDVATLENGGKPFIISFFATWCKPCNRELNAIHEVYPDWVEETGVRLIAVSIDEGQNAQKVKPLVESEGWEYEVLLDPNSALRRALGVQMIPHVLIVDGKGKIVEQHRGYTEGSEEQLIEKVRELVAQKEKN